MSWVLLLNDMRASQIEIVNPRYRAETKDALLEFLRRERVETYKDGPWQKCYRKGGPLEWYNPPMLFELDRHIQDVGTADDWAAHARERYAMQVLGLPTVPE